MKFLILTLLPLFIFTSCSRPKSEPAPLTLIPADFKFVAKVNVEKALKIPGVGSRLIYEKKRKPSLQVLPMDDIDTLYLAAGSGKATEEKSSLYIAQMNKAIDLDAMIEEYKKSFSSNKDVLLTKSKFNDLIIHNIRDKKQELALCQLSPKTCIGGPVKQVLASLKAGDNNIQSNQTLQGYLKTAGDAEIAMFVLSSEDGGSLLQGITLFDSLQILATSKDQQTYLVINADCDSKETATKTVNALTIVRTLLLYSKGKFIKPEDIVIKQEDAQAKVTASFSDETMIELFKKD